MVSPLGSAVGSVGERARLCAILIPARIKRKHGARRG
jgi:hypothetical protein